MLASFTAFAANPAAEQLIVRGDAEVKALHAPEALALFQAAEKADPGDPEIMLRVSQQYDNLVATAKTPAEALELGRHAVEEARRAVELAPNNSKAHLALSVAYGRLTDFEDNRTRVEQSRIIKAEAQKALELDPRSDFALHVLGRWNYSVATLSPVLKIMAKLVYGGIPEASLEEAERDFKSAIDLAPQRVIHHHELARTYLAAGQPELARKEWEKELTLKPEDAESLEDQKEARAELAKKEANN